ncbi:AfsR/SARP family transcriptional regulator [Streptomyces sp. DSM 44915]|uniref:AfsR/SARP family transcriptional regulator n=1 Tax=Streptomyces chisholmiae TaxID=3075540 RepID=A0ABU2JMK7_9ACTN|nr:AfsR/SARP family transcriptional regulator [Streptomyces sp. DSM 44915]MDT0265971.1 AfsR/SARP family transcriptional regulator [Streptomyces sp. DSM 44915]
MADAVRGELLGPIRVLRDGVELPLGPPRQRAVLAVLLLQEGRPITFEALVDAVWGSRPPAQVRNLVQKYVSGIRRALGEGAGPRWTGSGYQLTGLAIDDLADRRALLARAVAARDAGDLARADALAARAEALWRGEFAEGLAGPVLAAERMRWAEKRLTVLEIRMEAAVLGGRHHACVHELMRQVAAHPLRERLVWLLMLALYRSGRSADALLTYEETRRRMARELGCDPGPELRQLHQRVLRQDPALSPDSSLVS